MLRFGVALFALALLAACGGTETARSPAAGGTASPIGNGFSVSQTRQAFHTALQKIGIGYIERRSFADLVAGALEGMRRIEPALLVIQDPTSLQVSLGRVGFRLAEPGDRDDAIAWSARLARTIDWLRTVSPAVAGASQEVIYRAAFDGMTSRLDRFSRYFDPDEADVNRAQLQGFGGIGVTILSQERRIIIQDVLDGTPARERGLRPADRILAIDGRSVEDLAEGSAIRLLRGTVGSSVDLEIQRGDTAPFVVRITREQIYQPTVAFRWEPGNVGYLRVSGFNEQTQFVVLDRLARARAESGGLQGLILDLRDNPGGSFEASIGVADAFLQSGTIVSTLGRQGSSQMTRRATGRDMSNGVPIVVLIDSRTASAAEIVASALQDNGRALVVGSRSYGKGSVQSIIDDLPNRGEIRFTSARWLTPTNYSFDQYGIIPNVCTSAASFDTTKAVNDLRAGRLDLATGPRVRRSLAGDKGEQKLRALEALCPADAANRDSTDDLTLARALLADPAAARRSARVPAVTARRPN